MNDIKFIISELNKPPFNKGLNIVSYDTLRGEQRLEILLQVFEEIDSNFKAETLRTADAEEVCSTILDVLRIMKYIPPEDIDPSEFRSALILGDRTLITHILSWILRRLPALKKRAYLSRFLVKIELSPEVEGDHDVLVIYQQYQRMIDEFKTIHNTYENLKRSISSVHEIQKDVKAMEEEKDQITNKLNHIKRRVDIKSNAEFFALVKEYREEKNKNDRIMAQLQQQEIQSEQIDNKFKRIEQQLKETKNNFQFGSSPRDLIERLAEEVRIKQHLIDEVLPSELEQLKRYVQDIENIEAQPSLSEDYLTKLNLQIQALNREINAIVENRMLNNDPMEDKMTLFRQNAANVAKKRETTAESLKEIEQEHLRLERELAAKRNGIKDGDQPLRGQALKQFINTLREKSNEFKRRKNELSELRTEVNVLQTTIDILKNRDKEMTEVLKNLENDKGIEGYFEMQEKCLNKVNDDNRQLSREELIDILNKLNEQINEKKTSLAPVIKDLKPLRQKCQDLQIEYQKRQQAYQSCAAGLETTITKVETEIKELNKRINSVESEKYLIECQLLVLNARQEVLDEEVNRFVSTDEDSQKNSILTKMQNELDFQQKEKQRLKELLKDYKNNEEMNLRQIKMWSDLKALIEVKHKCLKQQMENNNAINEFRMNGKTDHLIL